MIRIYNTLAKRLEPFEPALPGKVGMYVCGPTVYNYIHVGNARPPVVYDVFKRYLLWRGYEVKLATNITDVDDKIIQRAQAEGKAWREVAAFYSRAFKEDCAALNVLPPDYLPRAMEHIAEIIALIETLIKKGFAYAAPNGDVYFAPASFPAYGELSGQDLHGLMAGARIEVDEVKRSGEDFALWKAAKPGEPAWESPWGQGRPGWHIECSAMVMKYFGESVDIHGGGVDLIFPHHENEKAQSEAATKRVFARYWAHNGRIDVDNKKMSKSKGNFFIAREVMKEYGPETLRFFLLNAHYRSPINYTEELMRSAASALERLYTFRGMLAGYKGEESAAEGDLAKLTAAMRAGFVKAMDDDFNTADALSAIFEFVRAGNIYFAAPRKAGEAKAALDAFMELCGVLGLLYRAQEEIPPQVAQCLALRAEARARKDWAEADRLRDEIKALGYAVKDGKDGQSAVPLGQA